MEAPTSATTAPPCPVCHHDRSQVMWQIGDRLFATTEKRFSIRRCTDCRTDYLEATFGPDELAGYYPEGYWVGPASEQGEGGLLARASEFYRRLVLRDHVSFAETVIEQQKNRGLTPRIIDVGCGDGSYLEALGAEHCMGMDISESALRASQRRGLPAIQGTVCSGDLATAPFADDSFSLITSFHFLEHVSDPRPVLAELRRILHPDGDLILQVPNKDSWQARLLGRHWAGLDVPRHLVNYSATTLRRVLQDSGLEVVRESHYSLRDNPTTLANSLVPALYPPARLARRQTPTGLGAWAASGAYLAVVLAALPLTLLESALGRGAAVMVHARHS